MAHDSILPKPVPPPRTVPFREDCWTEEATSTLVDTWGRRFMELNRGNLRQKDWQEVADAVNALHGHTKKSRRTDVQCKNRIDTLKKKYKTEKARVSCGGAVTSSWLFYSRLDHLIGSAVANKKVPSSKSPASPPMAVPLPYRKPIAAIVQPLSILPQKRSSLPVNDSYFRRNYSAVAAAAAAEEEDEEESEEEEEVDASNGLDWCEQSGEGDKEGEADGIRSLARAIVRMGEMYERVEREKQKQMIDLEKQRMQFSKELEVQRMQLFMNMQVQVEKLKQANKQSSSNDK